MLEEDLAAEVYLALVRLTRSLRREAPSGSVSAGSLSALFALSKYGPLRPTALAELEGVVPASMTRILQGLEGAGLAQRAPDPSDGRAQLVALTEEGEALVRQGTETKVDAVRRRLGMLSGEDREALEAALGALSRLGEA